MAKTAHEIVTSDRFKALVQKEVDRQYHPDRPALCQLLRAIFWLSPTAKSSSAKKWGNLPIGGSSWGSFVLSLPGY